MVSTPHVDISCADDKVDSDLWFVLLDIQDRADFQSLVHSTSIYLSLGIRSSNRTSDVVFGFKCN